MKYAPHLPVAEVELAGEKSEEKQKKCEEKENNCERKKSKRVETKSNRVGTESNRAETASLFAIKNNLFAVIIFNYAIRQHLHAAINFLLAFILREFAYFLSVLVLWISPPARK